jgi:hypothetical protein
MSVMCSIRSSSITLTVSAAGFSSPKPYIMGATVRDLSVRSQAWNARPQVYERLTVLCEEPLLEYTSYARRGGVRSLRCLLGCRRLYLSHSCAWALA